MNYKIIEDVYLLSNGITFDKNINVLKLNRNHDIVYNENDFNYSSIIELPDDEYVDLTHYYSHWPFAHRYDCLSRIRHVENLITDKTKFLLGLNSTEGSFSKNRFKEESELFGIKNIIYHPNNNTLFKIKRLIYPLWVFGEAPCAFSEESFIYCRNKYNDYYKDGNEVKLFLTRTSEPRCILNSKEVHNFFVTNGFIIIKGDEDLKTMINYFYNAEIIIGFHGGVFSNILFCSRVKKIIEVLSSDWENYCFAGWNQHLKTNYINLKFAPDTNGNIIFNQNILNKILTNLKNKD
jgi:hypothetical protein